MPNLSFVKRKPEPLGTEFKCVVDALSGAMLWLEIQEGKERMANKEHQNLGSTAGCTLRGVCATQDFMFFPSSEVRREEEKDERRQWVFYADSWFGSVKTVANIGKSGNHAVMMVKTAHARSPKKWLEEQMEEFLGGTWIVLEGRVQPEDIDLISIGYKYNKKKVLTFIATKGAGSTDAGEPYEARFPDKFGNVCVRNVARPSIISNYFNFSNCVDLHNQARQFDLALEKKWVTQDGYFRLYTTLLGMNVTDAWKIMRARNKKELSPPTIVEFADALAWEMIEYAKLLEERERQSATSNPTPPVSNVETVSLSTVSSLPSRLDNPSHVHTKSFLKGGKQVRCIWCSRVNLVERKTTLKCLERERGFCREGCWSHHVAYGGVPVAPKKGTAKTRGTVQEER